VSKRDVAAQDKLAYYLLKDVNKAIRDYAMLSDGDRVAVAVSGGKDSLTLLDLLLRRLPTAREKYSLVAVHVTMHDADGTGCSRPDCSTALREYFEALRLEHAFEPVTADAPLNCYRCSHLRRKALLTASQRLGCNKVALGHHADDAAQTTLLNLIFHGRVETLHPRREFFAGRFVLIRPLIYLTEKEISRYSSLRGLPRQSFDCPAGLASRRRIAREIIAGVEREYPKVKINLFRAGLRAYEEARVEPKS
jgi:tRNA 2-thiocytidine biosynthesis protein TtcA